ncbi:MAG TPA: hypothetical protein VIS27_08655 [Yeosuana sp.]
MIVDNVETMDNFLNENERLEILKRIKTLQSKWKHLYPTDDIEKNFIGTLGEAVYMNVSFYLKDKSKIETNFTESRKMMIENFSDLFEKTKSFLGKRFEIPVDHISISHLTAPGFHIFRGPFASKKGRENAKHFHQDLDIIDLEPNMYDSKFIISFNSLINQTEIPAFLQLENSKHFYEYGKLNLFDSHLNHKIGITDAKEGDTRITYQGFMAKIKNEEKYHIYF